MDLGNNIKSNMLYFQHNMYDLENGHFGVLLRRGFCDDLLLYLKRLFEIDSKNVLLRVLQKLGMCAASSDEFRLRVKSLLVVMDFAHVLRSKNDEELLGVVAEIAAGWLTKERVYQAGFKSLLGRVRDLAQKILSLKLYSLAEPLVSSLKSGGEEGVKDEQLRREICRLHRQLVDPNAIQCLVQDYSRGCCSAQSGQLLAAFRPYSSEPMIQTLIKSKKKEIRLSLLATLTDMKQGVLPVVLEKLWNRQAWYVVRNCIVLLGSLKDPDLYPFAQPFYYHPDPRVQRQVLHCTVELGGEAVVARLISSYDIICDDVKTDLVATLMDYNDPKIGDLYIKILENRSSLSPEVREQIIKMICQSRQLSASTKTISVLTDIMNEYDASILENEPLIDAVKSTQQNLFDSPKVL